MNTIFTTIKFRLFAINTILSILLINNLNATEVYKSKAAGMGPNIFKQYSMVRANSNDGFIYSGTTKAPSGQDVIHILKTDDNFNTTWSYYYRESVDLYLNSTKICKTNDNSGYWICGYNQIGTLRYPFLMKIDNNGNVTDQIRIQSPGVFLDVEPTSDDGCIAVGFQSNSIDLGLLSGGRRGLIVKWSSTLTIDWDRVFNEQTRFSGAESDLWYENAENVTVVGNDYFIMGTVSYLPSFTQRDAVGYYCKLSSSGALLYQNTIHKDVLPYDAVFDSQVNKIYFVGIFDLRGVPPASIIGEIDVSSGIVNSIIPFEAAPGNPFPHIPVPYKIEMDGDELHLFGYVREYFDGSTLYTDIMIPFRARINKVTMIEIDFYINHTNAIHTNLYPLEDAGFLNAHDNVYNVFEFASLYVPEMGLIYKDILNNTQWGMIGYYNQSNTPPRYDLHLMNSLVQGECDDLDRNLEFTTPINEIAHDCLNVPALEQIVYLQINRFNMSLDSDECD